jgi:GH15 family glucan-1,4-alpha-glucosidase
VAFDRAIKAVERFGLPGPVERWRQRRAEVHAEVCHSAWDRERHTFTRAYGSRGLDASLLLIPLVGFLPGGDARVRGTVEAIERELCEDRLVRRYRTDEDATACPRARVPSWPAPSGSWTRSRWSGGATRPGRSSSGSSACETTWGSSPRNTTHAAVASSGTSRRPSRTSGW